MWFLSLVMASATSGDRVIIIVQAESLDGSYSALSVS